MLEAASGIQQVLVQGVLASILTKPQPVGLSRLEQCGAQDLSTISQQCLKVSVEKEWNSIPTATLKLLLNRFRTRIEMCIAADGGIFEN